ncbi:hypothetical protein CEP54_014476 [Fusarium duplospermum]|uniref:DUF5597 domain-containing protein n=1 Tax=Fusarium duplospermum TaxID=1325734 RepID=A0A428NVW4_9HYPO|nr:hypothetical protein CEP54_014476 [Fusarium duplospermum]
MVTTEIPYLRATPDSAQLIVKGQPFLMLPLELHTSSLFSEEYMETVWDSLKDCNFNTVLGSVTLEMIEPEEGKFNFAELDTAILAARKRGLLGDSRDRSDLANDAFQKPVPIELLGYLKGKNQLHPEFERKWPKFRESVAVDGPRADGRGARRAWLAYGTYKSLGCSPFGVDDVPASESDFTKPYGILSKMSKHILAAQAVEPNGTFGFYFDPLTDSCKDKWEHTFGKFKLNITRSIAFGEPAPAYGMIIHRGDGRFLFIGQGYQELTKNDNDIEEGHESASNLGRRILHYIQRSSSVGEANRETNHRLGAKQCTDKYDIKLSD